MFLREKRIGAYSYVYLVETVREDGTTKQRIIQNLGRKEVVEARGDLDRLARSAARFAQRSMVLSVLDYGGAPDLNCQRIGAPLLFDRLWRETGCRAVIGELLRGRRFEFSVERAIFLTVLHRLVVSAPTVPASTGVTITASTASKGSISIISTAPWLGSARSCRPPNKPTARLLRAASRIWWRRDCSSGGAIC